MQNEPKSCLIRKFSYCSVFTEIFRRVFLKWMLQLENELSWALKCGQGTYKWVGGGHLRWKQLEAVTRAGKNMVV